MTSESSTKSTSPSPWRKWGPLAGGLVVVALIAVAVVVASGDDDDDQNDGASPAALGVSFSQAETEGLDATYPDGCDLETGRAALPYFPAPSCYADSDGNEGATSAGVTEDQVTVVVYLPPESPNTAPTTETGEDAPPTAGELTQETLQDYSDIFGGYLQTYGRTVELKYLVGSGAADDSIAARADAVKAAEELDAFAVIGGPPLTTAWTEELRAREVICLSCLSVADPSPTVFSSSMGPEQTAQHLGEYLGKKLVGHPAEFAGDPALQDGPRIFAQLYTEPAGDVERFTSVFEEELAANGANLALQLPIQPDNARMQQQATTIISQLKTAGVTTVILSTDPVAPAVLTAEATNQDYFPEWVIGGLMLIDTTYWGRTFDQDQWEHAFGLSFFPVPVLGEGSDPIRLYKWYYGSPPPTLVNLLIPPLLNLYKGIQGAGRSLTPETFRDGLFAAEMYTGAVTQPTVTFGDHDIWDSEDYYGVDDFAEVWWDRDAQGADEIGTEGTGGYRYVDGGHRYLPGEWTTDVKLFDPEGTVLSYETAPDGDIPKEYPSPAESK